jgi:hypothetical protein
VPSSPTNAMSFITFPSVAAAAQADAERSGTGDPTQLGSKPAELAQDPRKVPACSALGTGIGAAPLAGAGYRPGAGYLSAGQGLAWTITPMTMQGLSDLLDQAWLTPCMTAVSPGLRTTSSVSVIRCTSP